MPDTKKTILIVDDEDDARAFAESVVSDIGDFNVVEADNGDGCLAAAEEHTPDLIILDVMMPGKDGFATFNALRNQAATQEIPVIMLTGVSGETGIAFSADTMGEYFGKAPEAFIEKPVNPAQLQDAVRHALAV